MAYGELGGKNHIKGREEGDMGARKVLRGIQANLGERGNYSYGELGGKNPTIQNALFYEAKDSCGKLGLVIR